ncbi:Thioredoxin domain-containing protein plp1 [Erysiphe neolycopersici]|uniref:Thioredoxin domain-containing protein plp1 n=1 Tax=Erysiphe neolycopersici TaxID=212602 RepID=A0A420I3U3_9PEZI|nr:Thioredoxin domain-containing protein plp1 [Erysiphe neolycopersici]
MTDRKSHEESVFDTSKPTLDDEDDLIAALEDDDSATFVAFREQRIQQLHDEYYRAKTRLSSGYGDFVEIKEEKSLMDLITSSTNIVVHFAKDDFTRCKIMDDHLNTLSSTHYNTRFVKIQVENAPFLVVKMGVKVLPCVLCWIDGKVVDRIVGFEGLGYIENKFTTKDLETRLLTAGVVQKSEYVNLKNNGKIVHRPLDEDLDDDDPKQVVMGIRHWPERLYTLKR